MKLLLSLLFSLAISLTSFGQNGVYLYGFMENAPAEPVAVDVTILSDSAVTGIATVFTESSGNIPVIWVDLPEGFEISWISAGFTNCNGSYSIQDWGASEFENLVDIPLLLNYCQDTLIYGCTDPESLNYDPNALVDDGSCAYSADCDLNEIIVIISTGSYWAQEISWSLISDTTTVADGGNYANQSTSVSTHCVPDGCYIFEMHDTYGDGWNGATFKVVLSDNTILASGTLNQGSFGFVTFGINQADCSGVIYGCTDPEAINYNPLATHDNGVCGYPVVNDICEDALSILPGITLVDNTNAIINVGIWGECWGFGQGEGEQSSVWYSFTTPDFPAKIHIEALYDGSNTLTDTQFGIFEECGGEMIYCDGNGGQGLMSALDFECGELAENTTYILMIDGWNGNAGTCFLEYTVDSTCYDPIYGCTDPEALNYNPAATDDNGSCEYPIDCDLNTVQIITQVSGSEMSWNLLNADSIYVASGTGYGNTEYFSQWCLEDGCYTLEMFPAFGTVGCTFAIVVGGDTLASGTWNFGNSGSLDFGINQEGCVFIPPVYGCTDPEALNYNPDALIDDGSCEYSAECDLNEIIVILNTNGSTNEIAWYIRNADSFPVAWGSGGYGNNPEYLSQLCLEDGCYTFEMFEDFGDGWSGCSFWIVLGGDTLASGTFNSGNSGTIEFGINQEGCNGASPIYGCTDPEATNYNPNATEDDGSCIYQFDGCSIDFVVIPDSTGENIIWIIPSDEIFSAIEVLWDFGDGTTSTDLFPQHDYSGDGPFTLCLTASFEWSDSSTCTINYCAVLSGNMVGGSGFVASDTGFSINVVNPQATVGINDPKTFTNLNLWPNPASDQLNVKYHTTINSAQAISILDITGKTLIYEVFGAGAGEFTKTIDVSSLPAGVYVLRLSAENYVEAKRFVIAK